MAPKQLLKILISDFLSFMFSFSISYWLAFYLSLSLSLLVSFSIAFPLFSYFFLIFSYVSFLPCFYVTYTHFSFLIKFVYRINTTTTTTITTTIAVITTTALTLITPSTTSPAINKQQSKSIIPASGFILLLDLQVCSTWHRNLYVVLYKAIKPYIQSHWILALEDTKFLPS